MTTDAEKMLCRTMLALVLAGIAALLVRGAAQLGIISPLPASVLRAIGWMLLLCTALPHAAWAVGQITSRSQGAVSIFSSKEDGWLLVLILTFLAALLAGTPAPRGDTSDLASQLSFPLALASLLFFFSRFFVLKRAHREEMAELRS